MVMPIALIEKYGTYTVPYTAKNTVIRNHRPAGYGSPPIFVCHYVMLKRSFVVQNENSTIKFISDKSKY